MTLSRAWALHKHDERLTEQANALLVILVAFLLASQNTGSGKSSAEYKQFAA